MPPDRLNAPEASAACFGDLTGPRNAVDAVATAAGTIGYEILTSLGGRHARSHVDASQAERRSA